MLPKFTDEEADIVWYLTPVFTASHKHGALTGVRVTGYYADTRRLDRWLLIMLQTFTCVYGREPGQRHRAGLRAADHHHALRLPELDPIHRHGPGAWRHCELHRPATSARGLVPRLLQHPARAAATVFISELCGELVDRGNRRRRRYVASERSKIHRSLVNLKSWRTW